MYRRTVANPLFLLGILIITQFQPQNPYLPKRTASSLYGDLELLSTRPTLASRKASAYMAIWLLRDTSSFQCRLLISTNTHSLSQDRIFLQVSPSFSVVSCLSIDF